MIKKIYILLVLCFPMVVFAQNWVKTVSENGSFQVMTPLKMEEKIKKITTGVGTVEYHSFLCKDTDEKAENRVYTVHYVDYPFGSLHQDSTALVADFLQATIESSIKKSKGKLIYENDIELDGAVGKIWRIDIEASQDVIKTKAFVRGNRFYTIQTICDAKNSRNLSTDTFFKSFKWVKKEY